MKSNINLAKNILVVFLLTTLLSFQLKAQNEAKPTDYTASLELKAVMNDDESRTYKVTLTAPGEEGNIPVYQATVNFYSVAEATTNLIGTAQTDRDGKAMLNLPKGTAYLKDKEGVITVKAAFEGKGTVSKADASVKFKEIKLSVELSEKDSVNSIVIKGSSAGLKGEIVPLKETTFNVYVQGLFSKLKIGDCFVDAGEGTFVFPKTIPGDVNGNLKIFVRLEENEVFGEVEKVQNAKWGNHRSGYVEIERKLWTSGAPIWMITTLIILLVGVWSHYLYAIIQLIKIGKEGKKAEKNH